MTDFSTNFIKAFDYTMRFEVGPWFDAMDPDTISGKIGTPLLNRKCGYTSIIGDVGGLTKFGIASTDNPDLNIATLTLDGARQVYWERYWLLAKCDKILIPVTISFFDSCVNNGVGRAVKLLQTVVSSKPDGVIGPITLDLVNKQDPQNFIIAFANAREAWYQAIIQNNPNQQKFLQGWLNRNTAVKQYALSQIS